MHHEATFTLDGRDTDPQGHCRISSLLGYLQRAAMAAAKEGGFGHNDLLRRYGAVWMLARSWVRLNRPIRWDDVITVKTWHRGGKAAMMYRDYDIYVGDERVGESVSGWVFANITTRKIVRLSQVDELEGTGGGDLCKAMTLGRWKFPADITPAEIRRMRYSDCDINGHVNNTRYADFIQDAHFDSHPEAHSQRFLSEMQINYTKECLAGENIAICLHETDNATLVMGMDEDGKSRFEGRVNFSDFSAI